MDFSSLNVSKNDLILTALGTMLFVIHLLPETVRDLLIFDHQSPSLISSFSTHFVHVSNQHLLSNALIGFTALFLIKNLFHKVGQENIFRKLTGFYLLILPWIITGLSFLIFNLADIDLQNSMGFSALALAFVGAIPSVGFYFFKHSKLEKISITESIPFFHVGLAFILASYIMIWLNSSVINFGIKFVLGLSISIVALLAYAAYRLMNLLENKLDLSFREFIDLFSIEEKLILGFSLMIFIFGALSVAPSSGIVSDGGLVNIISHMIGFTLGFYVTELYLTRN